MSKKFRRVPSPALAVSIVALVFAASGSAIAASKLVNGNSLIKINSLSGNRLKNGSITGKQIAVGTLGKVPSAATADSATTATSAGSASISKVTYVTASVAIPSDGTVVVATAACPSGTTVIGGGAASPSITDAAVFDSYPTGTSGWSARFYADEALTGTVTAICAPAAATATAP